MDLDSFAFSFVLSLFLGEIVDLRHSKSILRRIHVHRSLSLSTHRHLHNEGGEEKRRSDEVVALFDFILDFSFLL